MVHRTGEDSWQPFDDSLYEDVYTWRAYVDPYAVVDPEAAARLKEGQLRFSPEATPNSRSLRALAEWAQELRAASSDDLGEWVDSGYYADEDESEERGIRCHPIRTLVGHLDWLVECFRDVPRCTVTIR